MIIFAGRNDLISEDDVKNAMALWLEKQGYTDVIKRMGRVKGIDVEAKHPNSGKSIAIECKGENNAKNQWENAWRNLAHALFNLIKDSEDPESKNVLAMAVPDTNDYRQRMDGLQSFCKKQRIIVFWVSSSWEIEFWDV